MTDSYLAVQHAQLVGAFGHHGHGVHRVIETARNHRWPPPPMTAVYVDCPYSDPRLCSELEAVMLLGCSMGDTLPLTTQSYAESGGIDNPRLVRVDTSASYPDLVASGTPEFAEFRARLDALERALAQHLVDPNAHRKAQRAVADVLGAQARAALRLAADEIPFALPPESTGKIRPWRQGDCICVTACFPGADGDVRYLTTASPASDEAAKVARYVDASGVPPVEVLGAVGMLCNVLGAGSMVPMMCAAAPAILGLDAGRGAYVVRMQPELDPAARAILRLATSCYDGDEAAMREWDRLASLAEQGAPRVAQAMNDAIDAVQS
jgi:hypothetical protein